RLRGGDPRRGAVGSHPRRPSRPQPPARALHRRWDRHEGDAVNDAAQGSVAALRELEGRYAMPTYPRAPVEFVRGEGATLWDADGRAYVDLFSGLSVHNAGNCHPRIVAAISEQAATLGGTSNLFYSQPAMELTERLVESSLGGR